MNRFARRCHGNTGKRCVCQDEFLEHGNRFFSDFPMPRTLESFAQQSLYVGPGLRCRKFCDTWYTTKFNGNVAADYTATVEPVMTPEKKLVYEVFRLLNTHKQMGREQPSLLYVMSIKKDIKTDLRRKKLEGAMKDRSKAPVDEMLASLSTTYEESINRTQAIDPSEELGEDDDEDGEDQPANELYSKLAEKIRKKKYTN